MSVTLHTTAGDIKLEIFCESVPRTAENFLALCASNFYNNSPFHRSIPGFMIQTGSPAPSSSLPPSTNATKISKSIYPTPTALFEDEIRPSLRHNARGIVSMANKGPDTNGSQFFITYAPAPHLDGRNTVFGRVIGAAGAAGEGGGNGKGDGDGNGKGGGSGGSVGMETLRRLEARRVDSKGRMIVGGEGEEGKGEERILGVRVHANPLAG